MLKKLLITILTILLNLNTFSQVDISSLTKAQTLDVVTWNLEWFGAPHKSRNATSFEAQLKEVSEKILELDADVYAFQELVVDPVNGNNLEKLLFEINKNESKWQGVYSARHSADYLTNPDYNNYPAQKIAYIFNRNTVKRISHEPMFDKVYPKGVYVKNIVNYDGVASQFWASGRLPLLLDTEVSIGNIKTPIKFINIHAKCCSDSKSKKEADADYLFDYIAANISDDNLIILGDYNDYAEGSMSGGNSPYDDWFTNNSGILYAYGTSKTSGIDHISLSDELQSTFFSYSKNAFKYDINTSDHQPVMIRMVLDPSIKIDPPTSVQAHNLEERLYPNPARNFIIVETKSSHYSVEIYSILGKKLLHKKGLNGKSRIDIPFLSPNTYILKVKAINHEKEYKLTVVK